MINGKDIIIYNSLFGIYSVPLYKSAIADVPLILFIHFKEQKITLKFINQIALNLYNFSKDWYSVILLCDF